MRKKINLPKRIRLEIPNPHAGQLKVIKQKKRFNVVCCGRRFGKTTLGIIRLIEVALVEGKPVAWFAPTMRLMGDVWRDLHKLLKGAIIKSSQQDWRIELKNGGSIEMWSLDSSDSGRGRAYALVVIDEAAMIPNLEKAWEETIRQMLADFEGEAWFLSTPKGMNYFKVLFEYGQDPSFTNWASWQMPNSENPFMPSGEIEEARKGPESVFNQEWLAQFIDGQGSVFRYVPEAATVAPGGKPEAGHVYFIGCDWGRSNDSTAFMVVDETDRKVVDLDCFSQVEYAIQRTRLKALADKWKPQQIIAEQNSIGGPIIELLRRDGLRVQAFTTTNSSKAKAVDDLVLAFEQRDIRILNDPRLVRELIAYQAERLPSGLLRYGAPSGQHDDCVMALLLAWTAVSGEGRRVYPILDADLVVPEFAIPANWRRAYGFVVIWNRVAVVWGALDPHSDVLYICGEYLAEADLPVHAAAIRSEGDWIPGLMDPTANGRDQIDGEYLMQALRKHGLVLQAIDNPLQSGVSAVLQRMRSGRLKVFASCVEYLQEHRLYRHDEGGQIVQENDDLQDALRCLVNGIASMRTKPVQPTPYFEPQRHYGKNSWMV